MSGQTMEATSTKELHKIVVNLDGGRVVKGFLETSPATDLASLLDNPYRTFPKHLTIQTGDNGAVEIDVSQAKAVFFVKSFEGNHERRGIRFYANGPAISGIWVEIQFKDDEVVEGIIENSLHHIIDDGFLLSPSDPDSNNSLIYVNKKSIQNYRVLGVRMIE